MGNALIMTATNCQDRLQLHNVMRIVAIDDLTRLRCWAIAQSRIADADLQRAKALTAEPCLILNHQILEVRPPSSPLHPPSPPRLSSLVHQAKFTGTVAECMQSALACCLSSCMNLQCQ